MASHARADGRVVLVLSGDSDEARRDSWSRSLAATMSTEDVTLVPDLHASIRAATESGGAFFPSRVAAFAEVSDLITRARSEAAALREGRALRLLAQAEQIAEAHADVPGASAWLAEVETAIGITAAQASLPSLSQAALLRAATLDPRRGVRAAEAPPPLVAAALEIARSVATGPTGTFQVLVDAPDARVILDDGDVGGAPRTVRASVGQHVLRIEAPGFLPYGQVIHVLEGERSPIRPTLARDPLLRKADELLAAARAFDAVTVRRLRDSLVEDGVAPFDVWLLSVGEGRLERALLTTCNESGCNGPLGLTEVADARTVDVGRAILGADRTWLLETAPEAPPPPPSTPLWKRWYVWAGAAVVASAAVGTTAWLMRDTEPATFQVVLDPGDLSR